jgi:hypothetical protein
VPIVVDVDELHTPEYTKNLVTIEEEHNQVQEARKLEEEMERTKSDTSRGPRPQ